MIGTAVAVLLAASPVADFALTDAAGKPWRLHAHGGKAVVLVFLAPECPMSNGYLPTLATLARAYAGKGVAVVGVVPDPDASPDAVRKHAAEYGIPFPVLLDPKQAAAAAVGATVTPEAVVLDDRFVVRYRGRVDDGYAARMKPKPAVTRADLAAALDEVLAGKPVRVPRTEALGCPIRAAEVAARPAGVTFHKDVLPVLQAHCQSCHRPGQVAPFSLLTYRQARRWADLCAEEVEAKRMPPWKPAPNDLLAGGRALPAAAATVLREWAAAGMPEGDPADAPPPRPFADGWTLGEPDLVLEPSGEVVVDGTGRDLFRVLVYPTGLTEDRYLAAIEVRPGNPRVVHHTLAYADTRGRGRKLEEAFQARQAADARDRGPGYTVQMGWGFLPDPAAVVGGWAPGALPKRLPDGVGQLLPKGSDLLVQFHYHRTGKVERDRTRIGLYFAKKPVAERFRSVAATGLFAAIPPGDPAYRVSTGWRLTEDLTLYRLTPHMHLLGKDIELTAALPDGTRRTLIRVPEWDYNWQEQYDLKEPLRLPKGTVLRVRANFDNSAANPHNPSSPPRLVFPGEETTSEMCFVFLGVSSRSRSPLPFTPVFAER